MNIFKEMLKVFEPEEEKTRYHLKLDDYFYSVDYEFNTHGYKVEKNKIIDISRGYDPRDNTVHVTYNGRDAKYIYLTRKQAERACKWKKRPEYK